MCVPPHVHTRTCQTPLACGCSLGDKLRLLSVTKIDCSVCACAEGKHLHKSQQDAECQHQSIIVCFSLSLCWQSIPIQIFLPYTEGKQTVCMCAEPLGCFCLLKHHQKVNLNGAISL